MIGHSVHISLQFRLLKCRKESVCCFYLNNFESVLIIYYVFLVEKRINTESTISFFLFIGLLHMAVTSGSWCGDQRQRCGDSGSGLI